MSQKERAGKTPDDLPFEAAIERLEEIASLLEEGDLELEKSLQLFEEGVALSLALEKRLSAAEMKVERLLSRDSDETETLAFPEDEADAP